MLSSDIELKESIYPNYTIITKKDKSFINNDNRNYHWIRNTTQKDDARKDYLKFLREIPEKTSNKDQTL